MYNLLSGIIGSLIAIMLVLNGILSNNVGNYTSVVIIHAIGLIGMIFLLIIKRTKVFIKKNISIFMYSAGAIGVFTVLFNNLGFKYLGVSITLALCLLGQSLASIIIDHYGLLKMNINKFNKKKVLGLILISFGIVIMTLY